MLRAGQSGVSCPGVQLKVLLQLLKTMVCVFASPKCKNRMSCNTPYSFYRLTLSHSNMLKLWLIVLQLDANAPVQTLHLHTFLKMTTVSPRREDIQSWNTSPNTPQENSCPTRCNEDVLQQAKILRCRHRVNGKRDALHVVDRDYTGDVSRSVAKKSTFNVQTFTFTILPLQLQL